MPMSPRHPRRQRIHEGHEPRIQKGDYRVEAGYER